MAKSLQVMSDGFLVAKVLVKNFLQNYSSILKRVWQLHYSMQEL